MFKIFTKETLLTMGVVIAALLFIWKVNNLNNKEMEFKERQVEIKAEQTQEEVAIDIIEEQMKHEINKTKEIVNEKIPTSIGNHSIQFN